MEGAGVAAGSMQAIIPLPINVLKHTAAASAPYLQLEYLYSFLTDPSTHATGQVVLSRSYGWHSSVGMPVWVR